MNKENRIKHSRQDRIYFIISGIVLTIFVISVSYPLLYVVSASFSSGAAVNAGKVVLFPVDFSLEGYKAVFAKTDVWLAYANTIKYTIIGTLINIVVIMACAYPLSRKDLVGQRGFMLLFTFTMFFSGGMIPSYLLISRLKMIDTLWALVLPNALSVYNMIVARTFIQSTIPEELFEAATIDGCSDAAYFFKIVLPLSKAVIAVIALFSAVGHWNVYFNAMLYLNSRTKMPLQIILREILILNQIDFSAVSNPELMLKMADTSAILKYSLIVVSTVPILCLYPFVQKYFEQGVMIGSIKG